MLKEMFEQFVYNGGVCISYVTGYYVYSNKTNKMAVKAGIPFPYDPHTFEELVHRDLVDITEISIR